MRRLFLSQPFSKEYNNSRKISEKKEDVMKSDSTKISVVTGYDVVNKKNIQMTHHILSEDIISKISTASAVYLRYYVGASYINTEIKGGNGKCEETDKRVNVAFAPARLYPLLSLSL